MEGEAKLHAAYIGRVHQHWRCRTGTGVWVKQMPAVLSLEKTGRKVETEAS